MNIYFEKHLGTAASVKYFRNKLNLHDVCFSTKAYGVYDVCFSKKTFYTRRIKLGKKYRFIWKILGIYLKYTKYKHIR